MASRPTVAVHSTSGGTSCPILSLSLLIFYSPESSSSLPLPAVLTAPIRLDVVAQVHSQSRVCPPVLSRSRPHREHRKEQAPGLRRERKGRPPNLCRVLGYRSCRRSYSPCRRWWNAPLRPGTYIPSYRSSPLIFVLGCLW